MNGMRVLGMELRGPLRQQAVARHREEDARLAVLEHQQDRRHRHDGAERDDPADRLEPGQLQRVRQRIGDRQLLYGTMPVSTKPTIT